MSIANNFEESKINIVPPITKKTNTIRNYIKLAKHPPNMASKLPDNNSKPKAHSLPNDTCHQVWLSFFDCQKIHRSRLPPQVRWRDIKIILLFMKCYFFESGIYFDKSVISFTWMTF